MVLDQQSIRLEDIIKARALSLGFCLCGITDTSPLQGMDVYRQWIELRHHGGMAYLASPYHIQTRISPAEYDPLARSVIVLGLPYSLKHEADGQHGLIAGYANGPDYHDFLRPLMQQLVDDIQSQVKHPVHAKFAIDSAPLLERELGQRAGLGWIGRNSCLISPVVGSSFLLSEILLDLSLENDSPFSVDRCGICRRCVESCPTSCIQENRTVDSSRCISYLTIENKGQVSEPLRSAIGNRVFGCDICQVVCPWNMKGLRKDPLPGIHYDMTIEEMLRSLSLSREEFRQKYGKTALMRTKWEGYIRNLVTVLANQEVRKALPALQNLLSAESESGLRETLSWAINKISRS